MKTQKHLLTTTKKQENFAPLVFIGQSALSGELFTKHLASGVDLRLEKEFK